MEWEPQLLPKFFVNKEYPILIIKYYKEQTRKDPSIAICGKSGGNV